MPGGSFFVQQSAFATRPASGRRCRTPELSDASETNPCGGQADANVLTAREGWGGQPGHGPRSPSSLVLRPSSVPGPSSWVP